MRLSQLSATLLDQILGPQLSYAFLDLWLCGDRLLNAKLCAGLSSVDLIASGAVKNRFPRAVLELRALRHFKLYSHFNLKDSSKIWPVILRALPSSLKSLSLGIGLIRTILHNYEPQGENPEPLLSHYGGSISPMVELCTLFPHLEVLSIDAWIISSASDLLALPTTLTHLSCDQLVIDYKALAHTDYKGIGLLPRALIRLDCEVQFSRSPADTAMFLADWALAPPNLEFIRGITGIYVNTYDWLPRTLRQIVEIARPKWTLARARSLPPMLEDWELSECDHATFAAEGTDWAAECPQTLKTLLLGMSLSSASLSHLPRSITSIVSYMYVLWKDVRECMERLGDGSLTEKSYSIWPSSLAHFSGNGSSISDVILLPRGLRGLKLRMDTLPEENDFEHWCLHFPPSLESLSMTFDRLYEELGVVSFQPLPSSLTELDLESAQDIVFDIPSLEQSLPASLQALSLPITAIPWKSSSTPLVLPSGLTQLRVAAWRFSWNFLSLPATLTDFVVSNLLDCANEGEDFAAGLPQSLTALVFDKPNAAKPITFSASSFKTLPHLRNLSIVRLGLFPSATLRSLSPHLTSLCLPLEDMEEDDAPFIPKRLLHVNFQLPSEAKVWASLTIAEKYWPIVALPAVPSDHTDFQDIVHMRFKEIVADGTLPW